jgi:16S rRNA (cytidine1402-2'-O)-methyltransferase
VGLIFVPTPLGNLRDITLRGIDTLQAADLIVAEDTRIARRLLSALQITGKMLWSYREQSAERATAGILERAASGLVAVVVDAGTPGISDPGRALVVAARAADIPVEVLPGPAAFVCAAVLSGFELSGFSFEGFVPRKRAERAAAFAAAAARGTTSVWYEAPTRIAATLADLEAAFPAAPVFVARELTKRHEQHILGTAAAVRAALAEPVRGELVLVLGPVERPRAGVPPEADLDAAIAEALAAGAGVADAAKMLAKRFGLERAAVYARVSKARRGST